MPQQTIHISEEDAETLETYAQKHDLTVDEVVHRFAASLRDASSANIHPEVHTITGLVPSDANAKEEYSRHQIRKHD